MRVRLMRIENAYPDPQLFRFKGGIVIANVNRSSQQLSRSLKRNSLRCSAEERKKRWHENEQLRHARDGPSSDQKWSIRPVEMHAPPRVFDNASPESLRNLLRA
jgi:hypothetical protein